MNPVYRHLKRKQNEAWMRRAEETAKQLPVRQASAQFVAASPEDLRCVAAMAESEVFRTTVMLPRLN